MPSVGIFSRTTACRPSDSKRARSAGRLGHEAAAVAERPFFALRRLPLRLQFRGGGVIVVRMAAGQQLLDGRPIAIQPLRLVIRSERPAHFRPLVPVDAQPAEAVEDRLQRLLDVPLLIGVVDPQDELPAVLPGEQPIEQRGANPANVQVSGRTGSEAGADHEMICDLGFVIADLRPAQCISRDRKSSITNHQSTNPYIPSRCRSSRSRSSRSLRAFRSALVSLRLTGDAKGVGPGDGTDDVAGDAAR